MDIAGLVRGASHGEGLGNAFLSNIRAVDALFQIVRMQPVVEYAYFAQVYLRTQM